MQPASANTAGIKRWLVLIVALGIGWRLLRYALCFPFWGDEAYLNISILHRGYGGLIEPLEYSQIAPLLFLWVQRTAYILFGGGEYALRAFSLGAGIAAVLLFCHIAWRGLEPRSAAIAIGIFSGAYYLVRHTCESKPYAGDLFAATLVLWLGAMWLRKPPGLRVPLATCLAGALLLWLSYPAVFVAGGLSLALLAVNLRRPTWRGWTWWAVYNASMLTSFLLFFAWFTSEHASRAAGSWLEDYWRGSFPPTDSIPHFLWWLLKIHTGRMMAYPVGGRMFGSTLTTLLCVIGVVWLVKQRRGSFVLLLLAPALPTLIAAAMQHYPYGGSVRVSIHFAPAICLLAGAGAGALIDHVLAPRYRNALGAAVGCVLVGLPILGSVRDVLRPYKAPENARVRHVMAEVAKHVRPADNLAVYNPIQGTHGPPDGPVFHQSLRYYLELYTGVRPRWREDGELGPDVRVLLVYHGPDFGPQRSRVERFAGQAGLRIVSETEYALSQRSSARLIVYRCAPAADCGLPIADWARGIVNPGRKGVRNLLCEAPAGPFRQKVPDPFSPQ